MKNQTIKLLVLSLFAAHFAFAACDMAYMLTGGSAKPQMQAQLKEALEKELKKLNAKNTVTPVSYPEQASDSDYFFLMTPQAYGVRVALNNILINNTFYIQEYTNSSFSSGSQIISKITSDFAARALPYMNICK